jgi:hypothetical protein
LIEAKGALQGEAVAYNMGKKIPFQKKKFCGLHGGPISPDNVWLT